MRLNFGRTIPPAWYSRSTSRSSFLATYSSSVAGAKTGRPKARRDPDSKNRTTRVKTFEQLYCEHHRCDASRFRSRVFAAALPWRAKLAAPLLGGLGGKYFSPERDLLAAVGEAISMPRIRDEIRDYFMDPVQQRWLRRLAGVRLSTRRLQRIAIRCGVPGAGEGSETVFRE